MGSRKNICSCYLDHLDPDEMCDSCRDKHFERIVDHQEFMRESARDEIMLESMLQEFGIC